MAASKLARRIVESRSPIALTEAFSKAMSERVSAVCEGLKKEISGPIILTAGLKSSIFEEKLDNAVDFVMTHIAQHGIEAIAEGIEKSAKLYKVAPNTLREVFEDALAEDVVDEEYENESLEQFHEAFLSQLDSILTEGTGSIVGFKDGSAAYITPQESESIVEVYNQLGPDNKKKMVEALSSTKSGFKKMVNFSNGVI